jgi:hypothetical protein
VVPQVTEDPEYSSVVRDFFAQLESVRWFSNIGKTTEGEASVERIHSWADWPGPEDPLIAELSLRQQGLYDEIMSDATIKPATLSLLWDHIHEVVFRTAAPTVRFDPQQDSWYGPSAAVWQAAWTAGLMVLCLYTGRPIPTELREQWEWFVKGHWPSGYADMGSKGEPGRLLVY